VQSRRRTGFESNKYCDALERFGPLLVRCPGCGLHLREKSDCAQKVCLRDRHGRGRVSERWNRARNADDGSSLEGPSGAREKREADRRPSLAARSINGGPQEDSLSCAPTFLAPDDRGPARLRAEAARLLRY